jgi:hypothetical protein
MTRSRRSRRWPPQGGPTFSHPIGDPERRPLGASRSKASTPPLSRWIMAMGPGAPPSGLSGHGPAPIRDSQAASQTSDVTHQGLVGDTGCRQESRSSAMGLCRARGAADTAAPKTVLALTTIASACVAASLIPPPHRPSARRVPGLRAWLLPVSAPRCGPRLRPDRPVQTSRPRLRR